MGDSVYLAIFFMAQPEALHVQNQSGTEGGKEMVECVLLLMIRCR